MNLHSGYFPPHGFRRKPMNTSYHVPLTHSIPHPSSSSVRSARSSIESTMGNESFLPTISAPIMHNDGRRPYRRNDFANNHLFLAKRKLAGILLEQPMRNLQATSELIHLFDSPETRRRRTKLHKHRQQGKDKNSSSVQDAHLSVVNLVVKPPHSSLPTRDPLSTILRPRRSYGKSNLHLGSINPSNDDHQLDDSSENEHLSDTLSDSNQPLNPSILSVKSIIPSIAPHHVNHH